MKALLDDADDTFGEVVRWLVHDCWYAAAMRRHIVLFCLVLAWSMAGCAKPRLARTGPQLPPRPPDCTFHVFTTEPQGEWVEVGVVENVAQTTNLGLFTRKITKVVCEAGGEAVFVWMNGAGMYVKATVLAGAPPQSGLPYVQPPAPAPAPAPAAENPSGCAHDAQCKGDRICVNHQCVAPAAEPNAE